MLLCHIGKYSCQLYLFLFECNIMYCNVLIKLNYKLKYPILLPTRHGITDMFFLLLPSLDWRIYFKLFEELWFFIDKWKFLLQKQEFEMCNVQKAKRETRNSRAKNTKCTTNQLFWFGYIWSFHYEVSPNWIKITYHYFTCVAVVELFTLEVVIPLLIHCKAKEYENV